MVRKILRTIFGPVVDTQRVEWIILIQMITIGWLSQIPFYPRIALEENLTAK